MTTTATAGHLRVRDIARVASVGLRTRKLRAALSALGIAIGVAAIVAVLGLSSSSQAGLLAEIDRLGTNLVTVANGHDLLGNTTELPEDAPGMISRIGPVTTVEDTGATTANAYRSPLIPAINTNALSVQAGTLGLPAAVGTSILQGRYLNAVTAREPVVVLGAAAATRLGITRVYPAERIWVGGQWFYLAGILKPATLAPEIDASVLVGFPAAEKYLGFDGHPSTIYVRSATDQVPAVQSVLAATANPENPSQVDVSRPSDALVARAKAKSAFNGLFLGLGAVALLVGAVGVANIMVISVLERRSEIGLRRALGANKNHIRVQFLSEAMLLALLGGTVGVAAGVAATAIYATTKHWAIVVPTIAWTGGLASALLIGGVAGLLPALRAARMSPTQPLWGGYAMPTVSTWRPQHAIRDRRGPLAEVRGDEVASVMDDVWSELGGRAPAAGKDERRVVGLAVKLAELVGDSGPVFGQQAHGVGVNGNAPLNAGFRVLLLDAACLGLGCRALHPQQWSLDVQVGPAQ